MASITHTSEGSSYGSWWYTAKAQVILVGFVYVGVVAVYHAFSAMAGGIGNRDVVAQAGIYMHACMIFFSFLAPLSIHYLGIRMNLFFGAVGYFLYLLSLLLGGKLQVVSETWIEVGCAALGAGAACLWTAQGVITTSYPTKATKGTYFAIFWAIQNFGSIIQSFLTFVLNYQTKADSASVANFIVFLVFTAVGGALCWLLSPAEKVIRPDGSAVLLQQNNEGVLVRIWSLFKKFLDYRYLFMLPLFIAGKYPFTYAFFCVNKALFTTRTQGLNDTFYYFAQCVGSIAIGRFLDIKRFSPRTTGWIAILFVGGFSLLVWCMQLYANHVYDLDTKREASEVIDFMDSAWGGPLVLYVLLGFSDTFIQNLSNWLLGQLEDDLSKLSQSNAFQSTVQQIGGLLALMHFKGQLPGQTALAPASQQCLVNLIIVALILPCTAVTWYFSRAGDDDKMVKHDGGHTHVARQQNAISVSV